MKITIEDSNGVYNKVYKLEDKVEISLCLKFNYCLKFNPVRIS